MDVTKAISAKSDQQNAEDYIAGPRTIKITDVKVQSGQDQPIHISFDGDDGKVWKPCKTAARTLAAIWGADARRWIGLHCTIYCDPEVTWGGMKVGGIRVSHMEGLTSARTLMLTKTRGKKGATVIKPLEVVADSVQDNTSAIQSEAREAARQGKAAFSEWWKANKDKRAAADLIMDELKALCAEGDANE